MMISLVSPLPFPWLAPPYPSSTSTFSPAALGLEYIICGCLFIMYPYLDRSYSIRVKNKIDSQTSGF